MGEKVRTGCKTTVKRSDQQGLDQVVSEVSTSDDPFCFGTRHWSYLPKCKHVLVERAHHQLKLWKHAIVKVVIWTSNSVLHKT